MVFLYQQLISTLPMRQLITCMHCTTHMALALIFALLLLHEKGGTANMIENIDGELNKFDLMLS